MATSRMVVLSQPMTSLHAWTSCGSMSPFRKRKQTGQGGPGSSPPRGALGISASDRFPAWRFSPSNLKENRQRSVSCPAWREVLTTLSPAGSGAKQALLRERGQDSQFLVSILFHPSPSALLWRAIGGRLAHTGGKAA